MAERRPQGAGAVIVHHRDKDGQPVYAARIRWTDPDGKQRSVTRVAGSRRDAERLRAELVRSKDLLEREERDAKSTLTVAAYLDEWLAEVKELRAPRTYEGYRSIVKVHLKPALGAKLLTAVTADDLEALYAALRRRKVHPTTIAHVHACARRAFGRAVRRKLIAANPGAGIEDQPQLDPAPVRPLTGPQIEQLRQAARGDRLEALWLLLLTTGLREGEAFGVRWSDVDRQTGRIAIVRTINRDGGRTVEREKAKNKSSRRSVYLLPEVAEALDRRREGQARERELAGPAWKESDLVFTTRRGGPLHASDVLRRDFKPLAKRAGLPEGANIRQLRHSCASYLLARGVPLKVISSLLGHSRIGITADIYAHVGDEQIGEAGAVMRGIFGPKRTHRVNRKVNAARQTRRAKRTDGSVKPSVGVGDLGLEPRTSGV